MSKGEGGGRNMATRVFKGFFFPSRKRKVTLRCSCTILHERASFFRVSLLLKTPKCRCSRAITNVLPRLEEHRRATKRSSKGYWRSKGFRNWRERELETLATRVGKEHDDDNVRSTRHALTVLTQPNAFVQFTTRLCPYWNETLINFLRDKIRSVAEKAPTIDDVTSNDLLKNQL